MKNMRDYLKDQGINLHKAKSWTLRSKSNTIPLKIKSWCGGYKNGSMFYSVTQGNLTVNYQGSFGFEDCISYKDNMISFIVDSLANDVKLQQFTNSWVKGLTSQKYEGSWRSKKAIILGKQNWTVDQKLAKDLGVYFSDCNLKNRDHKSLRYVVAEDRNGELIWTEFNHLNNAKSYADQIKGCVLDSEQRNRGIYRSKGYKLRKMKREKRLALNRMRAERL